ncbi:MAG TPA: helix-hairpin-helix domain-containing protein [Hanamia sp.]|nr:helix-hairpin-helix domain-containing protein [Hanamia sp.]
MKGINNIKSFLLTLYFIFSSAGNIYAQEIPGDPMDTPFIIEEQLENLTAANEDETTEDDSYAQEMFYFIKEPINLNDADAGILEQLHLLSPIQISNLLSYRKLLGNFINIYEIQAIPGWDLTLIRRIRPYITVSQKTQVFNSISKRIKNGENTLLVRATQILEKSKGYLLDSSVAKNYYPGSPQKILVRYKYRFGNLLQYGFTAEKDAGEQFFRGAQKKGFDFYSAHLFIRNLGIIKSLAIGDFSVNMGQGLIQWQSLAFNKGAEIMNVKRQSEVLRPYNSAGEIAFNRGIGITIKKNKWETTGFVSYRKIDAGFNVDTLNWEDYVSSLRLSGYHRTVNEITGKGVQGQLALGGNLAYFKERFHFGANAVHYDFEHTITKEDYLYNKYSLSGKHAGNYSIDYSFTYKNLHFFGEAAVDEGLDKAFINGLLINTDSRVAMSFLYRNISRGYQSLYSNAFTENTYPTNESGFYSGITITPTDFLRIDGYADFYHFPWLKYRTDAPTSGNDYMIQLSYRPNKQVEVYVRYKTENKPINYNPDNFNLNPVTGRPKQGFRTQFNYKPDSRFTFRSRVELSWFDKRARPDDLVGRGDTPQTGFLTFADVLYKPVLKAFSGNIRLAWFETDGYDSRMYAFENDVLYSYSIPVFFDKGFRYYFNLKYDISRKLSVWSRFSQTIYAGKNIIGSGLDEIKGNVKSEVKMQVMYRF